MFPRGDHHQSTFVFGPDIYTKLIPETHILYKINKCVDFSFVNKACRDRYSQDQGRPVKNLPETMFRSAIVQYLALSRNPVIFQFLQRHDRTHLPIATKVWYNSVSHTKIVGSTS